MDLKEGSNYRCGVTQKLTLIHNQYIDYIMEQPGHCLYVGVSM